MTEWQYGRNPKHDREETYQFLTYMVSKGYRIYSYSGGNLYFCTIGRFY